MHHFPLSIVGSLLCTMTNNERMSIKRAVLPELAWRGNGPQLAPPEEASFSPSKALMHYSESSHTFPKVLSHRVKRTTHGM